MEADDACGINQTDKTIICSRDKDLKMIPGWHYGWPAGNQKEFGPKFITEVEALRNFYRQMLTGDPVDNIPGLWNVGTNASCVKQIDSFDSEVPMAEFVRREYEKRFGSYWELFMMENAKLLWIKREETNPPEREIEERLKSVLAEGLLLQEMDLNEL